MDSGIITANKFKKNNVQKLAYFLVFARLMLEMETGIDIGIAVSIFDVCVDSVVKEEAGCSCC